MVQLKYCGVGEWSVPVSAETWVSKSLDSRLSNLQLRFWLALWYRTSVLEADFLLLRVAQLLTRVDWL